jgi:hypothetical protein
MSEQFALIHAANALRDEIYQQMESLATSECTLARSYVRFGKLLLEFKQSESWRAIGYESLNQFVTELVTKWGRKRTQIYAYLSVVELLLPTIPADKLEAMGISKALELKYALEKQRKALPTATIPEDVIAAALKHDTTGKELRAMIGAAFNQTDDREAGTWYDCNGFYMTPEERKEYAAAVKMTIIQLGLKKEMAEHMQRKAVYMAWMQEYFATHAAEVYGVDQPENQPAQLIGAH